ncbi:hypothetical protein DL96DRAFT_1788318 [Flagelloscypha sp. PMI_526]|nr:hypothetical protein DL96DRAFT_1788318 [Flagelloscypha sp. PMI_526]
MFKLVNYVIWLEALVSEEVGLNVDLNAPFLSTNSLKCFVCVLNNLNAGHVRALRNYRVRTSKSPRCSIREAIHVTLADGVRLPPVWIQDEQFINALSGFANPSYEIIKELPRVFPKRTKLACFVNVGAGHPVILSLTSGRSGEEKNNLLRNPNVVGQHLAALCSGLGPCYFRLSVEKGAESSTLGFANGATQVVKSLTMAYLEETEVSKQIDMAVESLVNRCGLVDVERLGSLAAEDGKTKLSTQMEAVHEHMVHLKKAIDDDLYCKIKDWLSPIDQTAKLDDCIRARTSSTCAWFWNHPKVIEWKRVGGIFWCHAGMGTGKTIVASHVIETLINVPDDCFIAYYYFEFTNPSTLSEEAFFRSIISQISHANEHVSRQFYEKHQNGSLHPQLTTLHKVLRELITTATVPVYIIIDALDEHPLPHCKYLLESLLQLFSPAASGVHVLATSRDEVDIHEAFSGKVSLDFVIKREMVHRDIATLVTQELAAKKWQSWPKEEVERIRNFLIGKADGMFRMVACQIEVLNNTQTMEDMRKALSSLPATLSETYLYILNSVRPENRPRALTLLCILAATFQPMSVAELSALLTVKLGDPLDPLNLPVYRDGLRYHEPHNIICLGTALVRQTEESDNGPVLQLSHASVKEYLLQYNCSWSAFDDRLAHETTARACLALLIHNEDRTQASKVTQIEYTASSWWGHIKPNHSVQLLSQQKMLFKTFPWTSSSIGADLVDSYYGIPGASVNFLKSPLVFAAGAGLEQLLHSMLYFILRLTVGDLNNALEAATQMECSPEVLTVLLENGADANFTVDGTPLLHYGAISGSLHVVDVLVRYGAKINLNLPGELYESSLQAAAASGSVDVIDYLLKKGAHVNLGGGDSGTALQKAALTSLPVVEFLVEMGADVNIQGGFYGSALQAAAKYGFLDIVQFLVENGADVNFHGGNHGSALQAAASEGALDVVEFLVKNGADVNMQGGDGGSPLQEAALVGALDVVEYLVDKGVDVNMQGGFFGSALHGAALSGSLDITKFLVEKGANVSIKGGAYGSALHTAVQSKALDVVEYLIERGADINTMGRYGTTLEFAERLVRKERHKLEVVAFLIRKGAVRSDGKNTGLQVGLTFPKHLQGEDLSFVHPFVYPS